MQAVYACPICGERCEAGVDGCVHFDPDDVTWAAEPDGRHLLGTQEVADLLGWSRNMVSAYHSRGSAGFPPLYVVLAAGPVWRRADIERWDATRPRRAVADRS